MPRRAVSTSCRRKGKEEGVSLRVDLDPSFCGGRGPDDPTVLGQSFGGFLSAERVQEPRRALDVREEEGDGADRKVVSHAA
jgi:hypothetical protein